MASSRMLLGRRSPEAKIASAGGHALWSHMIQSTYIGSTSGQKVALTHFISLSLTRVDLRSGPTSENVWRPNAAGVLVIWKLVVDSQPGVYFGWARVRDDSKARRALPLCSLDDSTTPLHTN